MDEIDRCEIEAETWVSRYEDPRGAGSKFTSEDSALDVSSREGSDPGVRTGRFYLVSGDGAGSLSTDLPIAEEPPSQRKWIGFKGSEREVLGDAHLACARVVQ